jgi:hypothetical protein
LLKIYTLPNHTITIGVYILETQLLGLLYGGGTSYGLLTSRINKIKKAKLCFSSPCPTNKANYIMYRNIYNSLIRTSKKLYFAKALEANSKNLKKTWSLLKALKIPSQNLFTIV